MPPVHASRCRAAQNWVEHTLSFSCALFVTVVPMFRYVFHDDSTMFFSKWLPLPSVGAFWSASCTYCAQKMAIQLWHVCCTTQRSPMSPTDVQSSSDFVLQPPRGVWSSGRSMFYPNYWAHPAASPGICSGIDSIHCQRCLLAVTTADSE